MPSTEKTGEVYETEDDVIIEELSDSSDIEITFCSPIHVVKPKPSKPSNTSPERKPRKACGTLPELENGNVCSSTFRDSEAGPSSDKNDTLPSTNETEKNIKNQSCAKKFRQLIVLRNRLYERAKQLGQREVNFDDDEEEERLVFEEIHVQQMILRLERKICKAHAKENSEEMLAAFKCAFLPPIIISNSGNNNIDKKLTELLASKRGPCMPIISHDEVRDICKVVRIEEMFVEKKSDIPAAEDEYLFPSYVTHLTALISKTIRNIAYNEDLKHYSEYLPDEQTVEADQNVGDEGVALSKVLKMITDGGIDNITSNETDDLIDEVCLDSDDTEDEEDSENDEEEEMEIDEEYLTALEENEEEDCPSSRERREDHELDEANTENLALKNTENQDANKHVQNAQNQYAHMESEHAENREVDKENENAKGQDADMIDGNAKNHEADEENDNAVNDDTGIVDGNAENVDTEIEDANAKNQNADQTENNAKSLNANKRDENTMNRNSYEEIENVENREAEKEGGTAENLAADKTDENAKSKNNEEPERQLSIETEVLDDEVRKELQKNEDDKTPKVFYNMSVFLQESRKATTNNEVSKLVKVKHCSDTGGNAFPEEQKKEGVQFWLKTNDFFANPNPSYDELSSQPPLRHIRPNFTVSTGSMLLPEFSNVIEEPVVIQDKFRKKHLASENPTIQLVGSPTAEEENEDPSPRSDSVEVIGEVNNCADQPKRSKRNTSASPSELQKSCPDQPPRVKTTSSEQPTTSHIPLYSSVKRSVPDPHYDINSSTSSNQSFSSESSGIEILQTSRERRELSVEYLKKRRLNTQSNTSSDRPNSVIVRNRATNSSIINRSQVVSSPRVAAPPLTSSNNPPNENRNCEPSASPANRPSPPTSVPLSSSDDDIIVLD